jgi:hypothetical protein
MDRVDAMFILSALTILAVMVNVFGLAAAFAISGSWFVWAIVVGFVAGASTYKDADE